VAAYRAGLEVSTRISRTQSLAVVAYFASLDALTAGPQRCFGRQTCEICGPIGKGHNLESRREALARGLLVWMRRKEQKRVREFLNRAYDVYRSAYVHSARTPMKEYKGPWRSINVHDEDAFWSEYSDVRLVSTLSDVVRRAIDHEIRASE